MQYDTFDLIARTKRMEAIPTNQQTFTEDDFVDLLNIEFQATIVPFIKKVNEEYFVKSKNYTITPSVSDIEIPNIATGLALRDVVWVNNDGTFGKIARLTPEQVSGYSFAFGGYYGLSGYYLRNNRIVFYPQNTSDGTVQVLFHRRPNDLCLPADTGRIISINTLTNEITLDNAPDTSTWTTGTLLCAINPAVPFNFVGDNQSEEDITSSFAIVARSGFVITVDPSVTALLSVGDIFATKGQSPVPQYIPVEAHHLLCQSTAMRCLQNLGDRPGWEQAAKKYMQMEQDLQAIINPRVVGEPKKIVGAGGIMGATRLNTYSSYW